MITFQYDLWCHEFKCQSVIFFKCCFFLKKMTQITFYLIILFFFEILAFPGKCWEPTTKTPVKPGRSIDIPNICLQMTCMKDLRFSGVGCISEESLDPNCHEVDGDLSLPFPDCCPRYECRDEDGNNFII